MKIVSLTENEGALTGYSHVAHLKGANGDLAATTAINIITLSTNAVLANVVMDVVTSFGGTVSIGVAASASSGTTFMSAVTMTAAGSYIGSVFSATNLTASRFLTAVAGTGSATCEGFLWFRYNDHSRLRNAVTS